VSAPHTSIVILTRNQLAVTRACVESIARWTPEPHELVFVDNGSTDGTPEYLRSIEGAVVIENERNLGFGGGCNQGIAASTGERVLLLNNDVVVTEGWLAALHAALDSDPAIGIAGPRSNRVAGIQQVDDVGYDVETLDGLDAWAATWRAEHAGQLTDSSRLVGFCMLVEREVIDRIGGFDLRYGLGNFEDDDFCLRAVVAGWRCSIAHGSWIHHVGSRTFAGEGIDYRATMAENLRRFASAWRMQADELDPATGAYRPDAIVRRTPFDHSRHYAPLLGEPDAGELVELHGARTRVVAVCCDAVDPDATAASLARAFDAFGPADDVTIAVRISPRDAASMALLEQAADAVGDAALPDIALVQSEHDLPLLRRADVVVAYGRLAHARSMLAAQAGCAAVGLEQLDARLAARPAA
jgi:GT2 family glycosyltransferase